MKEWDGVQFTSLPLAENESTFLSTTVHRVMLPTDTIPPPFTDEEALVVVKKKRKSKKSIGRSSAPQAKRAKL